ncbi:hypothetical protein SUGI_1151020 [Cryptomeria japonica]|nr:hypothetical protein SUGI_1151020 [Cryptomeria japonica]
MPIIALAYPCMNSSYNVSSSTLQVIMEEFQRGSAICENLERNKVDWTALFEPYPFFDSNYLEIDLYAEGEDDPRKWKGWVESKLRVQKPGVQVQEGEPFDVRACVEEFKQTDITSSSGRTDSNLETGSPSVDDELDRDSGKGTSMGKRKREKTPEYVSTKRSRASPPSNGRTVSNLETGEFTC